MNALSQYQRMSRLPAGKWLFSRMVSTVAPYFGSIDAVFEDLQPGYCRVRMKKRRAVTNHLKTVHAIAMCNMAELAGGTMTEVSIPQGARWIPAGMTVRYLKKAKTDLIAEARGDVVDWRSEGEVEVPVTVSDTRGETVFTAAITMHLRQAA